MILLLMMLACGVLAVLVVFAGSAALAGVSLILVVWLVALTIRLDILCGTVKRLESRLNIIFQEREREYRKLIESSRLDAKGRE